MRVLTSLLALTLLLGFASAAATQPADPPKKDPSGLRISVIPVPVGESDDGDFHLDIVLHNGGKEDLNLYLGWASGNNGALHPMTLSLTAVDKDGKSQAIPVGREIINIGGRLDPFVVSLVSGGSYSLRTRVHLGGVAPAKVKDVPNFWLPPGTYTFTAGFASGPVEKMPAAGAKLGSPVFDVPLSPDLEGYSLMHWWSGTITSPPAKLDIPGPKP